MTGYYRRTVDDVTNMLSCAKQKDEELNLLTQIFYHPSESECDQNNKKLQLMVVDEDFVKKLESGERFIFKGSNDEKVVLCTENETYEVKKGEVSNSLLLCPNLLYSSDIEKIQKSERTLAEQTICGVHHSYLELRLTFPRLSKLKSILAETEYSGPDKDTNTNDGYYFGELMDIIQCSKNELLVHLKDIKALYLEGKWRVLSLSYVAEVFSHLLFLMEKQKWTKINALETKKELKHIVPEFIINHILMHYSSQLEEDENLYELKEESISRCFAELLLKTAEGKFRFDEFMLAWGQCLAPVIKTDLNHLKGLVLIEKEGQQKVIHLFPEYDLPENIQERFRLLFKRKEKWTLEEIKPYIEKLATKTMHVDMMLTKYTRSSNVNETRLFCAKYSM